MAAKIPKLTLTTSSAAATTYSFVTEDELRSWALCTVNDVTGELLITSDWGSWSYRWHASPASLGAPNLTAFIGGKTDIDYLARKLAGGDRNCTMFSSEASAKALNKLVCEKRLADGREQRCNRLEPDDFRRGKPLPHLQHRYTDEGLPRYSPDDDPYLSAEEARQLWDKIESVARDTERSADLFIERLFRIDGFTLYVTDEPWHHLQNVQTPEDRALRDIVLPALIQACKKALMPTAADDGRMGALRAFVAGYVASRPGGEPLGQEAQEAFDRWWNDPNVAKARASRQNKEP